MTKQDMDFSDALRVMKRGGKVARAGWNGKGMHVYKEDWLEGAARFGADQRAYLPVVVLFNAQGAHQPGWLPSQADMLAADWCEV